MNNELIHTHEGLPSWFPYLVSYILDCLKDRDRFNIYNARKMLRSSLPEQYIYTTDIREALNPFIDYGIDLRGKHQQVMMPRSQLLEFWKSFYLPGQSKLSCDLSFFANQLRKKRHKDLINDDYFRKHLPGNYKSLKKERLVVLILRAIFNSRKDYETYCSWAKKKLSPNALRLNKIISMGPIAWSALRKKLGQDIDSSIQELFESLLARAYYIENSNSLHLHISPYNGHAEPFKVTDLSAAEPVRIFQCLKPILNHISSNLDCGKLRQDEPVLRFPWAQLKLMRRNYTEYQDLYDFLDWWRRVLGFSPVNQQQLPTNYIFAKGKGESSYGVLALENFSKDEFINIAEQFELLRRDSYGRLTLTQLGEWIGGGHEPNMGVKEVWARNIDRLSLQLSPDWPSDFRKILLRVAVCKKNIFFITRRNILKSGVDLQQLFLILGSFVNLDVKKKSRLQSWFSSLSLPTILQASAVPIERIQDKRVLQKTGKEIVASDSHYIVIGLSPNRLKKYFQEDWEG